MRYAWTLLLAGALSLGLAGAALAAPDGFKEHKLPGLAIDLPSDWQIAPKEALAQVQKQAGDMKVLLMAQSPEVPQFAIMEQPVGEMDQAAFAKLDEDGVKEICAQADILIAAVGRPNTVTADMVKDGACVIDVGINRVESSETKTGYRLVGDVDFDISTGKMLAIIVPGPGCVWGFLGREKEYIIPFCDICQIGDDIILVRLKEEREKKE